jgi:hypothetical protein
VFASITLGKYFYELPITPVSGRIRLAKSNKTIWFIFVFAQPDFSPKSALGPTSGELQGGERYDRKMGHLGGDDPTVQPPNERR